MTDQSRAKGPGRGQGSGSLGLAHAPYNFVPLPDRALEASPPPDAAAYHPGRHNGHIDLRIEALTPLYVRGTAGLDQPTTRTKDLPGFFAPTGLPAIPGSSIRGMLRTLVEIASAASFDGFTDSRYSYRAVAEHVESPLATLYRGRLATVEAGYLRRVGDKLEIVPARRHHGHQYWRVRLDAVRERLGRADEFSRAEVVFTPREQTEKEKSQRRAPLVHELRRAGSGEAPAGSVRGTLIISGMIGQGRTAKKHAWIIAAPDDGPGRRVAVCERDERVYREGWSQALQDRTKDFPLLPDGARAIPCFYVTYTDAAGNGRVAIGHTRWFRVPYVHSVGDRVPAAARTAPAAWDLARAIFGRAGKGGEAWAGRVFVEDATLEGDPTGATLPAGQPHVLSTPKPTTFQHYLDQDRALETRQRSDLLHWDSDGAHVRGYKLYWHRPAAATAWQATDEERRHNTQLTTIEPVKAGSVFHGRIRFENLSDEELGALLFVLDLPEGCRHKIGMAKPLGFGSVAITADVHLDDRRARYRTLFSTRDGVLRWSEPAAPGALDKEAPKARFAAWLLAGMGDREPEAGGDPGGDAVAAAWRLERLAVLKALLTWPGPSAEGQTGYMKLDGFGGRPVFPTPFTVLGGRSAPDESRGGGAPPPQPPSPRPDTGGARLRQAGTGTAAPRPPGPEPRRGDAAPRDRTPDLDALRQRFGGPDQGGGSGKRQDTKQSQRARRDRERIMRQLRGDEPPDPLQTGGQAPSSPE